MNSWAQRDGLGTLVSWPRMQCVIWVMTIVWVQPDRIDSHSWAAPARAASAGRPSKPPCLSRFSRAVKLGWTPIRPSTLADGLCGRSCMSSKTEFVYTRNWNWVNEHNKEIMKHWEWMTGRWQVSWVLLPSFHEFWCSRFLCADGVGALWRVVCNTFLF
jgi:hypothetical protein